MEPKAIITKSFAQELGLPEAFYVPVDAIPYKYKVFQGDSKTSWVGALNIYGVEIPAMYIPNKGLVVIYELVNDEDFYFIVPCILSTRETPTADIIGATQTLFLDMGIEFTETLVSSDLANKIILDIEITDY